MRHLEAEICLRIKHPQTGKPVVDEIWSTSLSDTYRIVDLTPAGQPTTGYLVTVKPHKTTSIVIDYGNRTWSKTIYLFGSASDGRRAAGPAPPAVRPRMSPQMRETRRRVTALARLPLVYRPGWP